MAQFTALCAGIFCPKSAMLIIFSVHTGCSNWKKLGDKISRQTNRWNWKCRQQN